MTNHTGNKAPLKLVASSSVDRTPKKEGGYTVGQKLGATVALLTVGYLGYDSLKTPAAPPAPPKAPVHSIDYLYKDPMEKKVVVQEGDNGTVLAERYNHDRLSGQALLDVAQFVNNEGSGRIPGVNGEPDTHFVRASDGTVGGQRADIVNVPMMSDQQIADVNSGKIQ